VRWRAEPCVTGAGLPSKPGCWMRVLLQELRLRRAANHGYPRVASGNEVVNL
jgi:hypothetical protein